MVVFIEIKNFNEVVVVEKVVEFLKLVKCILICGLGGLVLVVKDFFYKL